MSFFGVIRSSFRFTSSKEKSKSNQSPSVSPRGSTASNKGSDIKVTSSAPVKVENTDNTGLNSTDLKKSICVEAASPDSVRTAANTEIRSDSYSGKSQNFDWPGSPDEKQRSSGSSFSNSTEPKTDFDSTEEQQQSEEATEPQVIHQQFSAAMEVTGAQLSIVVVKHLRNEAGPSSIEIQTDETSTLSNVLMESIRGDFAPDKSKKKHKLESGDTDGILLEVLKSLRFYGWHLLTSNSFMHNNSSSSNGKKVEATFYFERVVAPAASAAPSHSTNTTPARKTSSVVLNRKVDDGTTAEEKNGSSGHSAADTSTEKASQLESSSNSFTGRRQSFNREKLVQKYTQHRKSTFSAGSAKSTPVASNSTPTSASTVNTPPSYNEAVSTSQNTPEASGTQPKSEAATISATIDSDPSANPLKLQHRRSVSHTTRGISMISMQVPDDNSQNNEQVSKTHSRSMSNVQLAYQQAIANSNRSSKPPLVQSKSSYSMKPKVSETKDSVNVPTVTPAIAAKGSAVDDGKSSKPESASVPTSVEKPSVTIPDRETLEQPIVPSSPMGRGIISQDTMDDRDFENVRPVTSADDSGLAAPSMASESGREEPPVGPSIMGDMRKIQSMRPPPPKERSEHDNNKVHHYSRLGSAFFNGNTLSNTNRRAGRGTGRL